MITRSKYGWIAEWGPIQVSWESDFRVLGLYLFKSWRRRVAVEVQL